MRRATSTDICDVNAWRWREYSMAGFEVEMRPQKWNQTAEAGSCSILG